MNIILKKLDITFSQFPIFWHLFPKSYYQSLCPSSSKPLCTWVSYCMKSPSLESNLFTSVHRHQFDRQQIMMEINSTKKNDHVQLFKLSWDCFTLQMFLFPGLWCHFFTHPQHGGDPNFIIAPWMWEFVVRCPSWHQGLHLKIAWKSAGLHQEIPEILTTIVWTSAMAARNVWKALSQGNMKPYHVKKNLQLLQLSRFSNGLWLWQKVFGSAQLLFFRHKAGLQHCDICQLLSVICLFSGHSRGRPGTLGHLPSGFQSKACADGTAQRGASK